MLTLRMIRMIRMIKNLKYLTTGLVMAGATLFFATTAYAETPGQLTGNNVRVRQSPSLECNSNILFQVSRGQAVEILDIAYDFYRVNVRGYEGVYIFRDFVREVDLSVAVYNEGRFTYPTSPATVEAIIAYAKSYIGVPYRFGSMDPSRGFDCSGFVNVVMRNFDIPVNRSSRDMAANNGFQVDRNELLPGDLVFFNTNGRNISHVGIYIGGGEFIHSASCRGVKISGMNETYYRTRFVRANRVL